MRVLLIVNDVPKDIANLFNIESHHPISWIDAMKEVLSLKVELVILFPFNKRDFEYKNINNITYIGFSEKKVAKKDFFSNIVDYVKPDLVHIFGTEKKHNYYFVNMFFNKIPILLSLQGIIFVCEKWYYGGLSFWEILKNTTLRDFIFNDGILSQKRKFKKQIKIEQSIFHKVKYVEGRTDWDFEMSRFLNDKTIYFSCPRIIRDSFYKYHWCYDNCEKYSIFVHQGGYPLKGFHFLLDAVALLKEKYNIKVYISGNNCFERKTMRKKISTPGYVKIINKKIKDYNLTNNIVFTGMLGAQDLAELLSRVNVCVVPSVVENSSNSLAEAMVVGTPCIASYVGGNPSMLEYGKCGLLYPFNDVFMLKAMIEKYFTNRDLCIEKSKEEILVSHKKHDKIMIINKLLSIYEEIIEKEGNDNVKID